jgi:hypothetical protein
LFVYAFVVVLMIEDQPNKRVVELVAHLDFELLAKAFLGWKWLF